MLYDHFGDDINARKLRPNFGILPELMNGRSTNQLAHVTDQILVLGSAGTIYVN